MAQIVIASGKAGTLAGYLTGQSTNKLDRIAICKTYEDPVGSGDYSYSLVDSIKSITWSSSDGIMTADVDFDVSASDSITGVFLFDSTVFASGAVANGDEIIRYFFGTSTSTSGYYDYVNDGIFRISNLGLTLGV
jgi:hypothetical protein